MTLKYKKKLFCRYVEHHFKKGYDISNLIFKPAIYFNFEKIKIIVDHLDKLEELDEVNYYKFEL